ncbi:hypothetical protein [Endozoicomonas sp. OPT23]|uniref:hypothetical protein n=1 Tax=Endozoicomonas sp. OPT23 TaxID=2072845 RepID=UPI00129A808A|nr:hypothetical protein [Endozoicomonas sp. OPT23]
MSQYESKHKDSLKVLREDRAPTKGVLVGGDGVTEFDFKSLRGRSETFEKFKASFEGSSEFKTYQSDYRELGKIPEARQVLKDQLHTMNDSLKLRVDMTADKITDQKHEALDKAVSDSKEKTETGIQKLKEGRLDKISKHKAEVLRLEADIENLKKTKDKNKNQRIPMLEEKYKAISKHAAKALKQLNKKSGKISPRELSDLKDQAVQQMKERRTAVSQQINDLKKSVESYSEDKQKLQNSLKKARADYKQEKKGTEVKKEIEGLREQDKNIAKTAKKGYKAAPEEARKQVAQTHRELRGRNNQVR